MIDKELVDRVRAVVRPRLPESPLLGRFMDDVDALLSLAETVLEPGEEVVERVARAMENAMGIAPIFAPEARAAIQSLAKGETL